MKKFIIRKPTTFFKGLSKDLIDSCLKEKGSVSDKKIREVIEGQLKLINASCDKSRVKDSLDRLLRILKDEVYVIEGDITKGKRIPLLVEIKNLTSETREKRTNEIFKILEDNWYKNRGTSNKIKNEEPEKKISSNKRSVSTLITVIRKDTLNKIINVLNHAVCHDGKVNCDSAARLIKVKKIYKSTIDSWKSSLAKHAIELSAYYSSSKNVILFNNAEIDLALCCELYKKITNEEPKIFENLPKKKVVCKTFRAKNSNSVVIKEEKVSFGDNDLLDLYFYVAGLIVENNYTAVSVDVICMYLNKELGFNGITKTDLRNALRKRSEFSLLKYGELISLEQGWKSWEAIKNECNPMIRESWVDCRFNLSVEDLKKFFPKVEVLSTVTENDGFYRVFYNRSVSSIVNWTKLVMLTVGRDRMGSYIFDSKLIERINAQLIKIEVTILDNNLGLKLENL